MPTDRLHPRAGELPDMSADLIAGRRFAQSWRGFDHEEVKQFLGQVAAQVRALRERVEAESSARREAEQRASHPHIDEVTLMSAVGEETAAILRSARSAAAEITAKAEIKAHQTVSAAEAKADELLSSAEALLAARSSEAEAVAADIRANAQAEAEELRQEAQRQAGSLAEQAAQERRETVEGAQAIREKILTDLARRRKLATVQIEQLRAGRERLLDAYLVVRRTLDEVTDELQRADAEARAAAEAVGHQGGAEADSLVELRGAEGSDLLNVFSDRKPAGPASDSPNPTALDATGPNMRGPDQAGPVVLAPKVTHVAGAAAAPGVGANASAPPGGATAAPPNRRSTGPAPQGDKETSTVVARQDAVESVRILRRGVTAAAEPVRPGPAPLERALHGPGKAGLPETGDEGLVAAGGLEPLPSVAPGGGPAPAGELGPSSGAEASGSVVTGSGLTGAGEPAPAAVAGGPGDITGSAGTTATGGDVDGLFARIRASRQEAANRARSTLAGPAVPVQVESPGGHAGGEMAQGEQAGGEPAGEELAGEELPGPGAGGDEPVKGVLDQRDRVTGHLESSLARRLKRALQDEQNSLLDRLRSLKGPATLANLLPGAEEHADRFVEAGRPVLEEAARVGAEQVAGAVGGSHDRREQPGVGDLAEELGRAIAEPLRQRLELAFQLGGDTSELSDALGAGYREWKTQRIEATARDQVVAAYSRGAYLALPEGALSRWVVDASEGPCPDCEDNALAGDQPKGEAWPTGQFHPPAHPGCRCALAPALPAVLASLGPAGRPSRGDGTE